MTWIPETVSMCDSSHIWIRASRLAAHVVVPCENFQAAVAEYGAYLRRRAFILGELLRGCVLVDEYCRQNHAMHGYILQGYC